MKRSMTIFTTPEVVDVLGGPAFAGLTLEARRWLQRSGIVRIPVDVAPLLARILRARLEANPHDNDLRVFTLAVESIE